jgi:hypothetical protein
LLDDESIQNFWNKGMSSVSGSSLGVEAIGEFQTLTNTYSAQFGGNGRVIKAFSKSGSNNVHGSAYEFWPTYAPVPAAGLITSQVGTPRQIQFGLNSCSDKANE